MLVPLGGEDPTHTKTVNPHLSLIFPIPFGWSFSIAPLSQPRQEAGPKLLAHTAYSTI